VKFFKNKNTSIRSSQGYSDVAAPGAGGSDPADYEYKGSALQTRGNGAEDIP
jgi:hypothetical protein